MIEIPEAGFLADFILQMMDGAGGLDGLDAAATGADQVVAVAAGDEQGEIGGAFVEAEPSNDSVFRQALEQAEDGGFVALCESPSTA